MILARRRGRATAAVATHVMSAEAGGLPAPRPNLVKLAQQAGLGTTYVGVPPRENPALDRLRKYGELAPGVDQAGFETWLDTPASWYVPPEYVTIDVDHSIRQGRFILVASA
ncbi:hypothetical protein GCM10018962_14420 [Dactylosporangium matsuzakiense]|uniref:Uncharacterized protein n=1 Tax=Dactylosporangium matsuzakiense TaxID=53360 RepID=A0A9W6KME6_9ACTN|nr:hypothetical protein GCM10017581_064590 [Dactylosporangium matsuzakiense]